MDFLQTETKQLEDERIMLITDRSYNEAQIEKYNRLINYYCSLYNRTLSSINSNRDVLELYRAILDFKNKIGFPSWVENISILSDEHLFEMISKMEKIIAKLTGKSNDLKENILDLQRAKRGLILENEGLNQEIEMIDCSISGEIQEEVPDNGRQMVKERVRV
ncbi:MAG: hypothetical protein IKJ43_00770 [Bacilli bacterium]|nr:hypothetical protein [Bacilli bacterium]